MKAIHPLWGRCNLAEDIAPDIWFKKDGGIIKTNLRPITEDLDKLLVNLFCTHSVEGVDK